MVVSWFELFYLCSLSVLISMTYTYMQLLVDSQYFFGSEWKSLTGKQKQIVCLSLYYASNWIRELVSVEAYNVVFSFQLVWTCKLWFLTPLM